MEAEFELTSKDWLQFAHFTNKRILTTAFPGRRLLVLQILVYIPFGMGVAAFFHFFEGYHETAERHLESALVFFIIWGLALIGRGIYVRSRYMKYSISPAGSFSQRQRLHIEPSGIVVTKADSRQEYRWSAIKEMVPVEGAIYFYIDTNAALVVPAHAFACQAEAVTFGTKAGEFMNAGRPLQRE